RPYKSRAVESGLARASWPGHSRQLGQPRQLVVEALVDDHLAFRQTADRNLKRDLRPSRPQTLDALLRISADVRAEDDVVHAGERALRVERLPLHDVQTRAG